MIYISIILSTLACINNLIALIILNKNNKRMKKILQDLRCQGGAK